MYGTLNAFLAASGSFFKSNSRVSVVTIVDLFGVPRVLFVSWVSAFLTCAMSAESKKAVVLLLFGGLVQPSGSSSLKIIIVLEARLLPAGLTYHFPFGAFPNPAFILLLTILSCRVASFL